jgi:hypothetical protein
MSTVARDSGGGDFKLVPAGAHVAICDQVIDLGIQDGGQYDPRQKIYLRWQVPAERVSWEKDGKKLEGPAVIGRTLSLSLSEKSNLRPLLESWRGKPFTPQELKGFDIKAVLGAACMIQVTHETGKDRQFAKVAAIMSLPRGTAKPALEGEAMYFDAETPNKAVFDKLSKWLKEKIENRLTPEAAIRKMARSGNGDDPGYDAADETRSQHEDIPF